jgi:hypothetical protein
MFDGWDSFYILIGGAAGALIGLMFVVATLTAGLEQSTVSRGMRVYLSPVVFHFSVVLLISAIASVPHLAPWVVSASLGFLALTGIVYSAKITKNLFDNKWGEILPDVSDRCFYGIGPLFIYLALAGSAAAVTTEPKLAVQLLAVILLVVLAIGIRNAWDLVTTIAQRRPAETPR